MNIQTSIALAAFLLALGGNITWLFFTYGNSEKRKLALERDFGHIKGNQATISEGIAHGFDDIERKLDAIARDLLEIRIWITRNATKGHE